MADLIIPRLVMCDCVNITINDIPPGLNRLQRMHWAKRRKRKQAWVVLLREAIGARVPKYETCEITITRYSTGTMDADNLASSAKWILDGLTSLGVIEDDNPDVITLEVKQERVSKRSEHRTVIELR